MRFIARTAVRTLAGAGLIGATALGLAAPVAAEEQPVDIAVSAIPQVFGPPGATLEVVAGGSNMGGQDMDGWSTDFTVPEGVTITGVVGAEILDGTERPDEGCALVTPQRLECHSNDTVLIGENADYRFEITLDEGASGELGVATFTLTADEGGSGSAETAVTAVADEVVIEAFLDPGDVTASPGAAFEQTARITNVGAVDMVGYSLDFFPGGGIHGHVTVTGIDGLELVGGAERPDEGCAVTDTGLIQCHTNATVAAGDTAEVTFQLRMPETAEDGLLGDTYVHVSGDNGGEFSDVAVVRLDVDTTDLLDVSVTPEVSGAAAEVVEIVMEAENVGLVGAFDRTVQLEVPEGATVEGVEGFQIVDELTPPEAGCVLETPQRVRCYRQGPILPGDTERLTFQVRFDDDAPAGELGVATLTDSGHGGDDSAETVLTVTAAGGDDGEELPDTGTSSTTVALAALGLLLAGGAALALRARRA